MAYRFKMRQCAELNHSLCTEWSDYKVLATQVHLSIERNEYSYIYVKGTGLNNFDASEIKVDNFTNLYHPYYRGLYLMVFNRVTLDKVFEKSYDLLVPGSSETLIGNRDEFNVSEYNYEWGKVGEDAKGNSINGGTLNAGEQTR